MAGRRSRVHDPFTGGAGNEDCLRRLGAHAQGDGTDCIAAPECDGERRIATIAGDYCSVKLHRRLREENSWRSDCRADRDCSGLDGYGAISPGERPLVAQKTARMARRYSRDVHAPAAGAAHGARSSCRSCGDTGEKGIDFQIMVGGEGEQRASLEARARALGVSDNVVFIGYVEDQQLPLCYAACDAFVLPTAELECFGLIALEALAAGRPVLGTSVGAIPEILSQLNEDWLALSASAQDIAALLERFLRGKLESPKPEALHTFVADAYSKQRLVGTLVDAAWRGNAFARYVPNNAPALGFLKLWASQYAGIIVADFLKKELALLLVPRRRGDQAPAPRLSLNAAPQTECL